jgi:hypothetical protein
MPLFSTILFLAISNSGLPINAPTNAQTNVKGPRPAPYMGVDLNGNTYLSIDPQAVGTSSDLCPQISNNTPLNPHLTYSREKKSTGQARLYPPPETARQMVPAANPHDSRQS